MRFLSLLIGLLVSLQLSCRVQADEFKPLRVISVGGALTEIVYALHADAQLVGVDTTSLYPQAATQLPQVGYQRQLSAEGVLSLKPDLVLVTEEAGPPAVLEQIQAAGTKLVKLPSEYSAEGVIKKIQGVADALNKTAEGKQLSKSFTTDLAAVQAQLPTTEQPKVVFLLSMGKGSPMVAGNNTAAHAMIGLAGGKNAFADTHTGYKPVSTEAMIAANPDLLLISKETLNNLGGIDKALATVSGLNLTPAGKHRRIATMEGLHLLGFGPRLPQATSELATLFHTQSN